MLTQTIEAGNRAGAVKRGDLKRVTVDTTVMEANIAHPTDARLYETARRKLVAPAHEGGTGLRRSKPSGRHAFETGGEQPRRGRPGRASRPCPPVQADAQGAASAQGLHRPRAARHRAADGPGSGRGAEDAPGEDDRAGARLPAQKPRDKGKLYGLHEPAVDGISKRKARKRCEFGTLVVVRATTEVSGHNQPGRRRGRDAGAAGQSL